MDARFRIGQTVEVMIETVAFGGDGVARVHDMVLFVPYTVDGDLAEVKVVEVRKNFLRGKRKKLLVPSPHRTEPECPYYLRCGGCRYQHIFYEHQLEMKRSQVVESFKRIGRFSSPP
jgi:23S rRNA (uracil1939-C5)-methyltransferase